MISEEAQLLAQLTQLSKKYRSKGLKFRDVRSVVDLVSLHVEDIDAFSDEFVVGLFSSLLDICTLSAADKRSAVQLGEQVGKLLVKISGDCVLWSIFRKCGEGVVSILKLMINVNKSTDLHDCSFRIQEGCADIMVPVQSKAQTFALQIFFCSSYLNYVTLIADSSCCDRIRSGPRLVDMMSLLICIEAPVMCIKHIILLLSNMLIIDSLSCWERSSLISGCVRYCSSILRMCLDGPTQSLSTSSTRNISALCDAAQSAVRLVCEKSSTFNLSFESLSLQAFETLLFVSQHFELLQVWVECEVRQGFPALVQEVSRNLVSFFLTTLYYTRRLECHNRRPLPSGSLAVLLRCCVDPYSQHLVRCCWSIILCIDPVLDGDDVISAHNIDSSLSGCDISHLGVVSYVEWCLLPYSSNGLPPAVADSQMSIDMLELFQELQHLTTDVVLQGDGSIRNKGGDIGTTCTALQLNKSILVCEILLQTLSSVSKLLDSSSYRLQDSTVRSTHPGTAGTAAAAVMKAYACNITVILERAFCSDSDGNNVASKRKYSQLVDGEKGPDSEAALDIFSETPSATAYTVQMILLTLNRIFWKDVVLVSPDLTTEVANIVHTFYKHIPFAFHTAPLLSKLSLPYCYSSYSDLLSYVAFSVKSRRWSHLWARILISFTFVVTDPQRPSVKWIHKTAAQLLESDLPRRHELLGEVMSFISTSLPRLNVAEVGMAHMRQAALQSSGWGLCNICYDAKSVLAFIEHNVIDMRCGKSMVDIICRHKNIPSFFSADDKWCQSTSTFQFHFQHVSALMEILVKYRWYLLLGENASQLLAWRNVTSLLAGLDSETDNLANADVSKCPAGITLLALASRSAKWWKCCKHVDVPSGHEKKQNDDATSGEVICLVKDIWKYAKACISMFLETAGCLSETQTIARFPFVCELLIHLRVWAVVEKCCCWPVGENKAGDLPWKVADDIDAACVSFLALRLPLHFSVTTPLSTLWLVGLLDASVSLKMTEENRLPQSQVDPIYKPTTPLLLTAEKMLRKVNSDLLQIHGREDQDQAIDGDGDETRPSTYKILELQLWVLVPCLTKLMQLVSAISPEISVWTMSVMCSTFHRNVDWVYHLYFENFVVLAKDGTLSYLLASHPQLSADLILPTMLTSTQLWERVLVTKDIELYQALKVLKARINGRSHQISALPTSATLTSSSSLATKPDESTTIRDRNDLNATLDKDPGSVLRLLWRVLALPGVDEERLVGGVFFHHLQQCATALNKRLDPLQFLDESTSQKALLAISWQLGSATPATSENALQALRAFCTCFLAERWAWKADDGSDLSNLQPSKLTRNRNKSTDLPIFPMSDFSQNVSEVFSRLFVYIFYKLVQGDWLKKSQRSKIHTIRALTRIISLLRTADLGKFLPKIMFAIESSLSHPAAQVQLAGAQLVHEVASRLPVPVLVDNAALLIVGFYPLLEMDAGKSTLTDEKASFLQHLVLNDLPMDRLREGAVDPVEKVVATRKQDRMFLSEETTCDPALVGISVDDICSIHLPNLTASTICFRQQAQSVAVRTLNKMFVEMGNSLHGALKSIPFFPPLPALQEVQRLHSIQQQTLSHEEKFHQLCRMLAHDSAHLRLLALRQIFVLLLKRRKDLHADLSIASSSGKGVISETCCLQHVLSSLVMLGSRDSDPKIREMVGKCLGEIGAVDPARVSFLPQGGQSSTSIKIGDSTHLLLHPKFQSVWSFGLILLEYELVPELRGDIDNVFAQDRTCFAIQTVLRVLALTVPDFAAQCKNLSLGEAQAGGRSPRSSGASGISPTLPLMPSQLHTELQNKQLLDTVEPYWTTNYHFKDVFRDIVCPIFRRDLPFERWLGLWCRGLSHKAPSGPFAPLFQACRGTLRTRAELSQLLLPFLVVEVLMFSDSPQDIMSEINTEICCVLSLAKNDDNDEQVTGTHSEGESKQVDSDIHILERVARSGFRTDDASGGNIRLAVQSIFQLMDTLHRWVVSTSQSHKDSDQKASQMPYHANWSHVTRKITELLNMVPNLLLAQAALSVDAHSRALRYFENHAREAHRALQLQSDAVTLVSPVNSVATSRTADEHLSLIRDINSDLPPLSTGLADYLMECFAHLEDSDSLQGVVKLRRRWEAKPSFFSRICVLEHTDKHTEALQEYDSIRASLRNSSGTALQRSYIERGRVRCLKEMGQLHAVLDQVFGGLDHELNQGLDIANDVNIQGSIMEQQVECAVLPIAIEAAWELQQWSTVDSLLCRLEDAQLSPINSSQQDDLLFLPALHREDGFRVSLAYVMSCLQLGDKKGFDQAVRDSRLQTMSHMQGMSCRNEAYSRAYPTMLQLHMLREAEVAFVLLHNTDSNVFDVDGLTIQCEQNELGHDGVADEGGAVDWSWKDRLAMLSPSLRHRDDVMALRRGIFELCQLDSAVAGNWLALSDMRSQKGDVHGARAALRHAEMRGLDTETVLIKECTLVKEGGNISEAIALLEPLELDVAATRMKFRKAEAQDAQAEKSTTEFLERRHLALRLFLTAKWLSLSHVKHGKVIIDRYKLALDLHKDWESANFELAKYYEVVSEKRKDELCKKHPASAAHRWQVLSGDDIYLTNSVYAMESYIRTVRNGHKHVLQALPKLLTIWFSISSLPEQLRASSAPPAKNHLDRVLAHIGGRMLSAKEDVPASTWYLAMPQLVSRVSHPHQDAIKLICDIVTKVMVAHSQQGLWHMSSLIHSLHQHKQNIAREIIQKASSQLLSGPGECDESAAQMLRRSEAFFRELVSLAELQPDSRRIATPAGLRQDFSTFLVPTQAALTICYPPPTSGLARDYFPTDQMFISTFRKGVDVMPTKAKPKKIELSTTCGQIMKFLVKQEKDGDLRKDERLMQFNGVVNRLLQDDTEGRKRQLKLRTFSVICLNEECGVLEWVSDTTGLRQLVMQAHAFWPDIYPPPDFNKIRKGFEPVQNKLASEIPRLANWYSQEILSKNKPCFHRWFLEAFRDPSQWLAARNTFTRSCAVWAAVGHIVGLGDRHGENILLDSKSGECVHVDFDCLFDKGLNLAKPELTPFRLTPNMVDAMGICGVEGGFRGCMEVALRLLRDHKDVLLSVLEPFIRDPTVSWNRSSSGSKAGRGRGTNRAGGHRDAENEDADRLLKTISERLDGIYNLKHPHASAIIQACKKRKVAVPAMGLGAQDEVLALSVIGQAGRLIDEATSLNNLAQMYIGWMPWL